MNDNAEKLINTIELLKLALNFYADKRNYEINRPLNDKLFSLIEMDSGSQARFALEKTKELENINQKIQDDYSRLSNELLDRMEDGDNDGETNPIDLIRIFKETRDDNNI
jgi:hypothetical protein